MDNATNFGYKFEEVQWICEGICELRRGGGEVMVKYIADGKTDEIRDFGVDYVFSFSISNRMQA